MKKNQIAQPKSDRGRNQTCDPVKVKENSGFNKKGYKKTKLGWIPEEWEIIKLGEVGEFKNGINKDKEDFGFGVPFINLMDVFGKPVLIQDDWDLVNANQNEIENYSLKKGDVLFIRSSVKPSGVGLTSIVKEDIHNTVYSGFLIRYRPNIESPFDIDYLQYGFYERGFRKRLIVRSSTSANTNINQDNLKKLLISLPPFPEQQKIATILSTWDRAIAKQQQLIAAKQEYKKGLMQLLLTGKLRFAGFEGEWERVILDEVTTINPKGKSLPNRFIYIDLESVKLGQLVKCNLILKENAPSRAQRLLKVEDILFQTVRPYQKNNLYFDLDEVSVASSGYAQIRTKQDAKFIYYLLHTDDFVNKVLARCTGTSFPAISPTDLRRIKVNLPKKEEQEKIASVLSAADRELALLENELEQMREQKRGLMQRLLTGEVRVKV